MSIKIYDSLNFSKDITIRNELPSHKKIIDYIGVDTLLSELENYTSNTTTHWFESYINVVKETTKQNIINESMKQLNDIGLHVGGKGQNYIQRQLTQPQSKFPWTTWQKGVGPHTRKVFENLIPGFNRPRYVEAKPGWKLDTHTDWNYSSRHGLRCHLMLEVNPDCKHFITDIHDIEHEIHMKPGEVWFLNVERPHHAYNLGSTVRKSLSFELINDDLL
jgi:hypothetical protein